MNKYENSMTFFSTYNTKKTTDKAAKKVAFFGVLFMNITCSYCQDNSHAMNSTLLETNTIKKESIFYVPNCFTPNNDIYNNTFSPQFETSLNTSMYALSIYNRWGQEIFNSKDIFDSWDGSFKGSPAEEGLYIWKMTIETNLPGSISSQKHYQGQVNLIR